MEEKSGLGLLGNYDIYDRRIEDTFEEWWEADRLRRSTADYHFQQDMRRG